MQKSFWEVGHKPTLFASFFYFDLSFMVWVMLGPLAVQIAADLNLSPAQKGLMVATPVLTGALLRIVMGVLVDQIKPAIEGDKSNIEDMMDKTAKHNVEMTIADILKLSPVIAELVKENKVEIVGAYYDITTGRVTFLE